MKLLGIFLIIVGLVVGLQFVLEPIYHISTEEAPYSSNWDLINYASLLAIIIGLVVSSLQSKNSSEKSSACTRDNIHSTGFFVLLLLFIWNYAQLFNESFLDLAATRPVHSFIWVIINVSTVLLSLSLGKKLLRPKS